MIPFSFSLLQRGLNALNCLIKLSSSVAMLPSSRQLKNNVARPNLSIDLEHKNPLPMVLEVQKSAEVGHIATLLYNCFGRCVQKLLHYLKCCQTSQHHFFPSPPQSLGSFPSG